MATAPYRSCPREAFATRSPACGGVASRFGLTGTSCRFPLTPRAWPLPEDRPARIGVVADTHGRPDARALRQLEERAPDLILHAGDIGDLAVLEALGALAPVIAVRGNIDAGPATPEGLPETIVLSLTRGGALVSRWLLTHIALHGPRLHAEVRRSALAERVDLVVCGHSHVPFAKKEGALAVFNPGSIGPRRFHLPIVFGWLELGDRLTLEHVDVETGARWRPGPAAGAS